MAVTHFVIDTETLGLKEHAVVTSFAAVQFTFEGDETYDTIVKGGYFCKFKIAEQIKSGRQTTQSTLDFWKSQPEEAKVNSVIPSKNDVTLVDGLTGFVQYLKNSPYEWKKSYLWARGPAFDFPKVEDLFDDAGIKVPFNTFRQRDIRTAIDILAGADNGNYDLKAGQPKGFVKHHALHDAALDAAKMKELYKLASGE
jgi:hypothetical protein